MFEAIALGILLSLVTGGSLRRLSVEPLRSEGVLFVMLPVQLLWPALSERMGLACGLSVVIWLLMMACLAVVLVINAPRRWMLAFAALGIAMNVLVIGLNGAMPVSIRAASEIGTPRTAARAALHDACLYAELRPDSALPFLADVIPVPGPEWQRGVVSVGDVLLALGLGVWVFAAARDCTRSEVGPDGSL